MKRFLLGLAIAAAGMFPALAADMTYPMKAVAGYPAYIWAGPYVGGNVGYGVSNRDAAIAGADAAGLFAVNAGLVPGSLRTSPGGFFGGIQGGWNWQRGLFVYGAEADFQYGDLDGSDAKGLAFGPLALATMARSRVDYFGTVRGRVGVTPFANTLVYGTGGFAWGHVTNEVGTTLTTPIPALNAAPYSSDGSLKAGWTVGAGVEHAMTSNWTMKAEYLYVDLGKTSHSYGTTLGGALPANFTAEQENRFHLMRVGANYQLPY